MSGKVRKEYVKTCAACPATFVAYHPNARYCPECRTVNKKHLSPASAEKVKVPPKRTEEKKKPLSLNEAAALARKAGMTYGQYIAKMERGE